MLGYVSSSGFTVCSGRIAFTWFFIIADVVMSRQVCELFKEIPLRVAQIVKHACSHNNATALHNCLGINKVQSPEALLQKAKAVFNGHPLLAVVLVNFSTKKKLQQLSLYGVKRQGSMGYAESPSM